MKLVDFIAIGETVAIGIGVVRISPQQELLQIGKPVMVWICPGDSRIGGTETMGNLPTIGDAIANSTDRCVDFDLKGSSGSFVASGDDGPAGCDCSDKPILRDGGNRWI